MFEYLLGLVAVLATALLLFVLYYTVRTILEADSLKHIPGPPCSSLFWGHFAKPTRLCTMAEFSAKYSPLMKLRFGIFGHYVFAVHPESIKAIMMRNDAKSPDEYGTIEPWLGGSILVTTGKEWQRARKLLTPAFHLDTLKEYVPVYNDCVEIMISKWTNAINASPMQIGSVEIYEDIKKLTLDVLMRCIFSQHTDCQTSKEQHPYLRAVDTLSKLVAKRANNVLYFHPLVFNFKFGSLRTKCVKVVRSFSGAVIKNRKAELARQKQLKAEREAQANGDTNDHAQTDDFAKQFGYYKQGSIQETYGVYPDMTDSTTGKRRRIDFIDILLTSLHEDGSAVTDEEIQPQVDMFMFAGHDTSSATMTWTLYHLAAHKDIQQRCREEVLQVLGGRTEVEHSDLSSFNYLTCCIYESLRLFPPVPYIARYVNEPIKMPDGRVLPKDRAYFLAINTLHHNPTVWEQPEVYDPSRFEPEKAASRSPHAFVPFSAGPRNCIGKNFALNVIKTSVATLLTRFVFEVDVCKEYRQLHDVISRPRYGLHLNVKPYIRD